MLLAAAEIGAHVLTETTAFELTEAQHGLVTVHLKGVQEDTHLLARFAVLAEGASGRLSSRVLPQRGHFPVVAVALRQYFESQIEIGPYFEVHAPLLCEGAPVAGYTWLFPVSERLLNVGVGLTKVSGARTSLRRVYKQSLRTLQERGRLHGSPCSPILGAPIPTYFNPPGSVGQGWLVIGDAAGVANPFTGEGIAQALESGELAAKAINVALRQGSTVAHEYSWGLANRFSRHLRLNGALAEMVGLVRTYGWIDRRRSISNGRSSRTARLIGNIVLDRKPDGNPGLWSRLVEGITQPAFWSIFDEVGERLIAELGYVSPLVAQAAADLRLDAATLPRYASVLVLAVVAACGDLDDETIRLAEVAELTALQELFHDDVANPAADSVRVVTSFNVLAGDAVIARLFSLLNTFEHSIAAPISVMLQSHADHLAADQIAETRCDCDATARRRSPMGCVGQVVGVAVERRVPDARIHLEAWAESLLGAVQLILNMCEPPTHFHEAVYGATSVCDDANSICDDQRGYPVCSESPKFIGEHLRSAEHALRLAPLVERSAILWTLTRNVRKAALTSDLG
jgi:flavin-dependent dehydrogenase